MVDLHISDQILAQLMANAEALRMPLEAYLQAMAVTDAAVAAKPGQLASIESFAHGMGTWFRQHVPSGHFIDDSRESIYPDSD